MKITIITLLLFIFAPDNSLSVQLENTRTETENRVQEQIANGSYDAELLDHVLHRFYADLDLLIWDGFTLEEKAERLKESIQQLVSVEDHPFICFLYNQYADITLATLGNLGKALLIENFCPGE
ncbi:MAG: hypothetical protein LUG98_09680 [Tannerellaceae bacterium]|nr:hypothetical protein [Tannerellaceae bacterium]